MPAVYGLPRSASQYADLIRATSGLVTYWPGVFASASSISNYSMPTQYTMEIWVKWTSVVGNRGILAVWNTTGSMLWVAVDSTIKHHVDATDIASGFTPTTGVWTYAAATYDGTSRAVFVNGSLMGGPTSGVTPTPASTPLLTRNYGNSGVADLDGLVADAAIYSRALGNDEIAQNYSAGLLVKRPA